MRAWPEAPSLSCPPISASGASTQSNTRRGRHGQYGSPAARRHRRRSSIELGDEIALLDDLIEPLVQDLNPRLVEALGVGTEIAGQLLVTAGDNPERMGSEAGFAMLCGVAPLPASSGMTTRHRLNRGGDCTANCALHTAVISRMRLEDRTNAYVAKRTADGLSKREIIRCLKRYLARELYALLRTRPTQSAA
jgi:transposase